MRISSMNFLFICLLFLLTCKICQGKHELSENDLEKYRLDEKGFEKVRTIHTNWYVHSMKALIAQLSRNLFKKLPQNIKEKFISCIYKIRDKKDLVRSSQCVIDAREEYFQQRKRRNLVTKENFNTSNTTTTLPTTTNFSIKPKTKKQHIKAQKMGSHSQEKGAFTTVRAKKMEVLKKRKPADRMQSSVQKMVLEFKKKWRAPKRQKRSLSRLVIDTVSKSDSNGYHVRNMATMPDLQTEIDSKSIVQRLTGLVRSFMNKRNETKEDPNWMETYQNLINLKKKMTEKEKEPGARVYNERMYDLVMDPNGSKRKRSEDDNYGLSIFQNVKMPKIMKEAFDLMGLIDGSKSKGNNNYKFLSPRFASIMPDKNENRGRLSPSILSFYNDQSEDQILPLPKMLEATGLVGKDRDSVIEMVMEVSGAKTIVHEAMKILKAVDVPELNGAVSESSRKSMNMAEQIKKSYNRQQRKEMKNNGFALLEPRQMRKFMKEQGIANRDDIFNVDDYAKLSMFERRELVWDMVKRIAYGEPATNSTRHKRQSWGPHILSPTVLTPVMFSPVFGLSVLGPTVLSPGLFTPLILNPAVLSPYVFSPTVGIPFILSPYVLSPYVFSPLVMAPFILTPYVLSPNVFNPYVLSPLILSPLVICPDVVSPMVLGGAILSPGVLSPSVLSKSYLMANVLSPTFLS